MTLIISRNAKSLFIILLVVVFLKYLLKFSQTNKNCSITGDCPSKKSRPIFVTSLCLGEKETGQKNDDFDRQLEHVITMIKSAAVLTTSVFNLNILVDNDTIYDIVLNKINQWPKEIQDKTQIEMKYAWFPSNSTFKTMFRICATSRLFLLRVFKNSDAVIYIDTDILFMRPPEELWAEFKNFNAKQMCGLTEIEFYSKRLAKVPYYGKSGFNAGVWMMNLTRMRHFPGGWEQTVMETFEEYKKNIIFADQDIANIIFNKAPEYLYSLGCHWNFRSFMCRTGKNVCNKAEENGIAIIHGNAGRFVAYQDVLMKIIYDEWRAYQPGPDLSQFLNSLKVSFKKVNKMRWLKFCSNINGMNETFLKGLKSYALGLKKN